jgi:glutamate/aspartate transport system permease protein
VEMVIFAALIYFVICYSLSFIVKRLQQRIAIKR